MKHVIVSVTNDLSTDQRVHKVCSTLQNLGFSVTLVGRSTQKSLELPPRNYSTKRMRLLFESGPLFYAEYQIRLFLYLLFHKVDVLVANDLDTLLPNYLVSKIKSAHLVYDTHELFCEVPELQESPTKKKIWKCVERFVFPKLKHVFTVNESIANMYSKEYRVPVNVVRNVPLLSVQQQSKKVSRHELNLPLDKKIILLQGAGINIHRGAEEAVLAMKQVNKAVLLIIGGGDVIPVLKQMIKEQQLEDKVMIIGKMPFEKLIQYTHHADIGLTLDKDTNLNYHYSLPNKLFDYLHEGVPVLASELTEVKKIIKQYQIGACINSHAPQHIADMLNQVLTDEITLLQWKNNTANASKNLNWEIEQEQLIKVYTTML
jgi:glycosyltransferase involved in cell wall biosynthesis